MRQLLYIENIFAFFIFSYYDLVFSNINFIFILGEQNASAIIYRKHFCIFYFWGTECVSYYIWKTFLHFYFCGTECVSYYI